ncbi:MAG: hypothetical protein JNG84_13345 [Archangium sp.]|nr:hypothetical protein [Archangium sp.]
MRSKTRRSSALKAFERSTRLVPWALLGLWGWCLAKALSSGELVWWLALLAAIYVVPVAVYRLFALLVPLHDGASHLGPKEAPSGWAMAHRFQILFHVFESLERVLRLFPGVYSAWLRAWGSTIGKRVVWTPHTRIGDRTHLRIGDDVFIGNASYLSPHLARRKNGRYLVLVKPIVLEAGSTVGTHCILGPGAHLKPGEEMRAFSVLVNGRSYVVDGHEVKAGDHVTHFL